MSSKQQPSRPSPNRSSAPAKSTPRSLIFSNFHFDGDQEELSRDLKRDYQEEFLRDLKKNYSGVKKFLIIDLEDNDGKFIRAIRIDFKSDDLAKQFLNKNKIYIYNEAYSVQSSTKLSFISKVPSSLYTAQIFRDLAHNYLGVEKVSRFYDLNEKMLDDIRIDFKSDASLQKIMNDNYMFIDGKQRPVHPYYTLTHIPSQNQNGENHASEEPQKSVTKKPQNSSAQRPQNSSAQRPQNSSTQRPQTYLTEERVKELFRAQQMQLEAMINEFDNKWNARLSSLKTSSINNNVDQLLPVIKDLTMVCQQFTQQNAQMQRQLGSVVHRVQDVQMNLNNEQDEQARAQLPIQNGH